MHQSGFKIQEGMDVAAISQACSPPRIEHAWLVTKETAPTASKADLFGNPPLCSVGQERGIRNSSWNRLQGSARWEKNNFG